MNNAPVFDDPLLGIYESKINQNYWDIVIQTYENKKYKKTILEILKYINPDLIQKTGNKDLSEFKIPHGSIIVNLKIKNGVFSVSVPFLKVSEKNKIALMRKAAEINFSLLILTQINLKQDRLFFEYEAPLELCDPYKLYAIFYEICNNADYYDDIFIEKLGAERIISMQTKKYPRKLIDTAWIKFHEYLNESLMYLEYFKNKRLESFGWDVLCLCFMKIDYYIAPQGFLRSEIERAISEMHKSAPIPERLHKAKEIIKKLIIFERKKFEESLYIPKIFISPKIRADLAAAQNSLKKTYESAKTERAAIDYPGATLSLLYGIYNLYYRNDLPQAITEILNSGLRDASKKTWKQASDILWDTINNLMETKSLP